jgi:3-deoxy-D-manno-octulosonate 8-phosphate phosphatase (KDO 8-P phosphatase)
VGWLTGRLSKPVARRAKHLRVPYLFQGELDKLSVAAELCRKERLSLSQLAYIGDDLIDLPLLKKAGWSATVPYGRAEVKKSVHYVTKAGAGCGAFREVVEKILKGQGKWNRALREFEEANRKWASLPPHTSD